MKNELTTLSFQMGIISRRWSSRSSRSFRSMRGANGANLRCCLRSAFEVKMHGELIQYHLKQKEIEMPFVEFNEHGRIRIRVVAFVLRILKNTAVKSRWYTH